MIMVSQATPFIPSPATAANSLPRAALALANVQYEKKGLIAYVTVNRPKVLNALNTPTWTDLQAAFEDARADASVHGVILTGAGDKAFIAGADISELAHVDAYEAEGRFRRSSRLIVGFQGYCAEPAARCRILRAAFDRFHNDVSSERSPGPRQNESGPKQYRARQART
jgi:Enoyl-CoA hydratase/isomerase